MGWRVPDKPREFLCVTDSYVCMYLMIGKGQIAQKDHIGAKIDLRAKFMGKYNCLDVFWKLGDLVPMLMQEVSGYST